eukprot:CAMPEP_0206140114 /NCGR_PEP_ID=MMETSP1473-20131121/8362_1 /ASSEMBLY_ACC=CAM_ASM_001109 /TAXON_ID=1461547 /ORGANISM="Stichococcus sp, Strain RCC1054" /LENGTH=124 /DNA_ID=CAMNT_0053534129 /DNA_START=261 /DNA_END=635 /DNA_ORIENTATION=-
MHQVAAVLVKLKELLELLANADLDRLIGRCLGPEAHLVLLLAHVHHHAADLIAVRELLPDARQKRVQPELVQELLAVAAAARHQDSPFAAGLALRVLPLGLDALLEQVEICPRAQPAGRLDVVV